MQFTTVVVALFAGMAAAQGGVCFDDFDCLGQGSCVKSDGGLVGSCSGSSGTAAGGAGAAPALPTGLALPTDLALPTGLALPSGFALPTGLPAFKREPEAEAEAQE